MNDFEVAKTALELEACIVKEAKYHSEASGSWYIIVESRPLYRLVWDGKNRRLTIERANGKNFQGLPDFDSSWISDADSPTPLLVAVERLRKMICE